MATTEPPPVLTRLLLVLAATAAAPTAPLPLRPAGRAPAVAAAAAGGGGKQVFAHYMLCFAAFGEKGNSSNATAGYMQEMAVARANGLDGFAIEYLGRDPYYLCLLYTSPSPRD